MKRIARGCLLALSATTMAFGGNCFAQDENARLSEPVYKVARSESSPQPELKAHSLDPALQFARESLDRIRKEIVDYTCVIVKREEIDGVVGEHEFMFAKIRNRKVENDQIVTPFSVYLTFLKPAEVKGRECLFVENANEGKLFAHEGGMKRMLGTHSLEPNSWLAMKGQRYPVTDIGIENLVLKLIERGERDRSNGECTVEFQAGAKVAGRPCTVLSVTHPEQKPHYDFYVAQIFIDDELQIPVRYAAYGWPKKPGATPDVIEEYTYQNLKINVGLTDDDFNVNNSTYNFHKK